MDDLISRQAVIEAVANTIWHFPNECYHVLNVYDVALALATDALAGLPPVTPTVNEDCISREWVLNLYKEWQPTLAINVYEFGDALKNAPSVSPTKQQNKEKEHDGKSICHTCATNNCPFQSGIYRNNCEFYTSANK